MTRSALALAALATSAVPGLDPVSVVSAALDDPDFDVAVVTDRDGTRWVVRSPTRSAAASLLDVEAALLPLLAPLLPVAVPEAVGSCKLPEGGRCVVHAYLRGDPLDATRMRPGSALAVQVGQVLGALHDVDPTVFDEAGVPVYGPDEYRLRRLADVDRAARTGHVPASLLARWEQALERVSQWRFVPTPVHGDLAGEHLLVVDEGSGADRTTTVSAIVDWGEARVADPADDLAWVCLGAEPGALDTVLEAYAMARSEPPDRHLLDRARLAGELAFARWLLSGVDLDDGSVVDAATVALAHLAERVADDEATHATVGSFPGTPSTASTSATTSTTGTGGSVSDPADDRADD